MIFYKFNEISVRRKWITIIPLISAMSDSYHGYVNGRLISLSGSKYNFLSKTKVRTPDVSEVKGELRDHRFSLKGRVQQRPAMDEILYKHLCFITYIATLPKKLNAKSAEP